MSSTNTTTSGVTTPASAVLCAPAPVTSVPTLSLEPVFRRSHGSLYKALDRGWIDTDRLRPTTWTWAAPTASS